MQNVGGKCNICQYHLAPYINIIMFVEKVRVTIKKTLYIWSTNDHYTTVQFAFIYH